MFANTIFLKKNISCLIFLSRSADVREKNFSKKKKRDFVFDSSFPRRVDFNMQSCFTGMMILNFSRVVRMSKFHGGRCALKDDCHVFPTSCGCL